MPLRRAIGELELPQLTRGVPALAEQVLRTLCWHLDTIVERQPRLARDEAVAARVGEDCLRGAVRRSVVEPDDEAGHLSVPH